MPRDDHTLSALGDNNLIVFGGFVNGSRVSDIYQLHYVPNATSLQWSKFISKQHANEVPIHRASHTSIIHNGKLYIFGGQDDENNKLGDMWEFDFTTSTWKHIEGPKHD